MKTSGNETALKANFSIRSIFPWFILGFLALAVVNSFGVIPSSISSGAKDVSKFLMVAALAAIGLNTSFMDRCKKYGYEIVGVRLLHPQSQQTENYIQQCLLGLHKHLG
ncbi:MAG: putative sulfate exporter family transporter [Paraprevotella sp.]|nr:putative sulfate exporter family transporter [Paraprevotella sp.]